MNIFGTDGIRAHVGDFPFRPGDLERLADAISVWAKSPVVIGHDTRISCAWIKATLISRFLYAGNTVIDCGVIPTPALLRLLEPGQIGIIISASHNLYEDNGIKIVTHKGKISEQDELEISLLVGGVHVFHNNFGTYEQMQDPGALYLQSLIPLFPKQFLARKKIVLDLAHGATYQLAPRIFEHFGAQVVCICNTPTGTNINAQCGALYPAQLQRAVLDQQADVGFAFDGDGDRVIMVDRTGRICNGDDMLALLQQHPLYVHERAIVGTTMANQGLELYFREKNVQFIRTQVGDKYIAVALEQHNLLLGGEQSGHMILRDYLPSGDGIFAALRLLQVLPSGALQTFTPFAQLLINVPVKEKKNLADPGIAQVILEAEKNITPGRLVVRYSGTEPVLRIMAESVSKEQAELIVRTIVQELIHLL